MNAQAFQRHGVEHLSASSLNLWAAQPSLWIMERLLGRKTPTGIPAARGKAVEHGVHIGLIDPAKPIDDCAAEAEREFNRLTALAGDPRRDEERPKIAGDVRSALAELRQYGVPDAYQHRVDQKPKTSRPAARADGSDHQKLSKSGTISPASSRESSNSTRRPTSGSSVGRTVTTRKSLVRPSFSTSRTSARAGSGFWKARRRSA